MPKCFEARRGMSIIEIAVVIGVVALLTLLLLPLASAFRSGSHGARPLKDSTQIRGIAQACAVWAQNTSGRYPTPSEIDLQGTTLPRPAGLTGPDLSLDTTGNTLSLLIWNGFFPVELAVNPAEPGNVDVMHAFQSASPSTAVNPSQAFWDPAFRGTPLDEPGGKVPGKVGDPSHNSYAQMAWFGERATLWSNTFSSTEACWGNRGPIYELDNNQWRPVKGNAFGERSITKLAHGSRSVWEGNIAFNDHHVAYVTQPDPPTLSWTFPAVGSGAGMNMPDNLFQAERDSDRSVIGENASPVSGNDGRGTIRSTGSGGREALDQRNNYLRPIARVMPGADGAIEAHIWID